MPIPNAASNLQLTGHTTSGAVLTWTDNSSDETGFKVQRRLGDGSWSTVTTTAANAVTYTDTDSQAITRNNPLTWRIIATNASGDSTPSNLVYSTLPPSPLGTFSTSWTDIYPLTDFPRPTRPARGGCVYDTKYGAKIIRITDEAETASHGTVYTYWSSFNADSTKLLEYVAGNPAGRIHTFVANPALGQPYVTGSAVNLPTIPGDGADGFYAGGTPIWDASNPDVLYAPGSAQIIYKYVVSTNTWSTYADCSTAFTAAGVSTSHIVQWQVEDNPSPRRFAFQCWDASNNDHGEMTIEKNVSTSATTLIYYHDAAADLPESVNEVSLSKNGDYMIMAYFATNTGNPLDSALRVVDLNTSGQPETVVAGNGYRSGSHYDLTETDIWGPDNFHAAFLKAPLTNAGQGSANVYKSLLNFDANNTSDYGNYQTTARAETSLGWVGISLHFTATGIRALDAELVMISTTGVNVRRYCHHFGNPNGLDITAISESGSTVTVTTRQALSTLVPTLTGGGSVNISGYDTGGPYAPYNGDFTVVNPAISANSFSYTNPTTGLGSTTGGYVNVGGYYNTTRANLSRNGQHVAFASDWGNYLVPIYMFVAETPIAAPASLGTPNVKLIAIAI